MIRRAMSIHLTRGKADTIAACACGAQLEDSLFDGVGGSSPGSGSLGSYFFFQRVEQPRFGQVGSTFRGRTGKSLPALCRTAR